MKIVNSYLYVFFNPVIMVDMVNSQKKKCTTNLTLNDINAFMDSLQRVFKIATYYPTGHSALDTITKKFLQSVTRLTEDYHSVTLEQKGNTLSIQEIELPQETPFVSSFNELMQLLGIASISIDSQITLAETHRFIRKMLEYRGQAKNAKKFIQIDMRDLPSSVTVNRSEFLTKAHQRSQKDAQDETMIMVLDALAESGLNEEEIEYCKELFARLPEKFTNSSSDVEALPYASPKDIGKLLLSAIQKKDNPDTQHIYSAQASIQALSTILQTLEKETRDTQARKAIHLLTHIIKPPGAKTATVLQNFREYPSTKQLFSADKISSLIKLAYIPKSKLQNIPAVPVGDEILSLLMQLCDTDNSLEIQEKMQRLFREHLTGEIQDTTWSLLARGILSVAQKSESSRIAAMFSMIIPPLRHSDKKNPLALLRHTTQLAPKSTVTQLWPFIVNELLISGSNCDPSLYFTLCKQCAVISQEKMMSKLSILKTLESFTKTNIAPDVFSAKETVTYPLFAFLLRSDIERAIGQSILQGLQTHPQDWLIQGVAPLLSLTNQKHKLFLYTYLNQTSSRTIAHSLNKTAVKIIEETLPLLPSERRTESWVPFSIQVLGKLQGNTSSTLLETILTTKKMVILHEWPDSCRKAAKAALDERKRRKPGGRNA